MIYFLDTSALVKAHVQEARSSVVVTLLKKTRAVNSPERVFVSRLAYVETASAIARRRRESSLSETEARRIYRDLADDFTGPEQPYGLVELSPVVLDGAVALVQRHPLRGFDAVHLSAALLVYRASPSAFTFVAADRRLLQAAKVEGLPILDLT